MWGEASHREIPFAAGLRGPDRRAFLPALTTRRQLLSNRSLGQLPAAGGFPQATGTSDMKCYRCGNQGVRSMLPSMAAMVPGGCVEVAQSECGAAPGSYGGGTPLPGAGGGGLAQTSSAWDGPTQITVIAKEPTDLNPYTNGADVLIQMYNIRNFDPSTGAPVLTEVVRAKTDAQGKYVWNGQAPSPNTEYRYRVTVSVSGGSSNTIDTPARSAAAGAAANNMVSQTKILVAACAPNIDSLVCAVAQAQLDLQSKENQTPVSWKYSNAGSSVLLGHPALAAHFETFQWWLGDFEIKPKDWPDLVKYYNQTWNIFVKIPFPRWPGIEKLFQTCARAIPIGQGKNNERYSAVSARLYVKRFSDYFPRTDKQISKDMAAAYILGLQPIMLCMQHRIERKIEETKRTMRTMAIISYCTVMINLPFLLAAGAGGFAAFATETYDFIKMTTGNQPLGFGVSAGIAAAALAAGNVDMVVGALEPVIKDILANVDPMAAKAITMIYPQVVKLAISSVGSIASTSAQSGSNTIVNGASSFIDMSTIASAIAVMAVKAVAALPKMYAAEKIDQLGDSLAGAQSAAQDVIGFVAGEEVSPTFKPFLIWVVEAMGLVELVDEAIDDFLDQFQQALEVGQAQGGGVAVVPEAGGGGPSVVPTDPEGVPIDVNGNPLQGGTAPITPPSGGSTIPGITPPPMPPMPTTTNNPGMEGVTGVTTIGAAAGVGGAALALLLVTGAVS